MEGKRFMRRKATKLMTIITKRKKKKDSTEKFGSGFTFWMTYSI